MQWQRTATYRIAAALRSTDGQGKGKAKQSMERLSKAWHGTEKQRHGEAMRGEGTAEKSADVICEGKVVHRNDSLRQGFASDALAWQRDALRRHSKEKRFY